MGARRQFLRTAWILVAALGVACGGEERRPTVPPGRAVQDLRRSAGSGVQDCGEATESKTDATCKVHSVGECLDAALKGCRPAYGMRSFFTSEGDAVRIDWLVLSDGHGGCKVVTVEDRSADPLARKRPAMQSCTSIVWKHHESIPDCEAPAPDGCSPKQSDQESGAAAGE